MLLPLAPTLKMLGLGGNKLGGTITDDIASFAKLEYLWLSGMGLKGTFAHDPAYKERLRENPGNEEQRAFLKLEVFFSLLRFVLCDRSLARSPGSPFFSLLLPHTVTEQELRKLLPGCGRILV